MRFPFSRFVVSERSMEPVFYEGDHVLTFNWKNPKIGEAVVVRVEDRNLIKRVVKIIGAKFIVAGDNKRVSSKVGPIEVSKIIGKVIAKY